MATGRKSIKKCIENAAKPKTKKTGYRIVFQTNLSDEQFKIAFQMLTSFRERIVDKDGYWNYRTRGGHDSWLGRGAQGLGLGGKPEGLLFRRVSNTKRIFGVVKNTSVERSGLKWVWVNNVPPTMYTVYEIGEIKGQ